MADLTGAHQHRFYASGLIFGLFGYLLVRGFVDRRALDIVVGLAVGALYGSILWGSCRPPKGCPGRATCAG